MKCTIEWKYYGNLRDVYLFGYYESEGYNKPPMLYATFTSKAHLIQGLENLGKVQDDLRKTKVSWKLQDSILIEAALKERNLTPEMAETSLPEEILLYIGKTTRKLAERLINGYDPGAGVPVYLLSIPVTEIGVLVGTIQDLDAELQEVVDKLEKKHKTVYDILEPAVIVECTPLLNKDRKLPLITPQITFQGDYLHLFEQ